MADLAVKVFNANKKRLLIVGEGPEMQRLKAMASKNIEFLGWVPDDELSKVYANCRALIFPGEEDFGIVPVEAQASGRPVIAYAKGGALETVIPNETGVFFYDRSVGSLAMAIDEFEKRMDKFDTQKIVQNAYRFSKPNFLARFEDFVSNCTEEHSVNFR
jgi:glycosyltransferase involved in cell wall biosynthesis